MRVLYIAPGKAPEVREIKDELSALQEAVGGLIQVVYPFRDPVALVCNDEGKLLGMEPNRALRHPETGEVYDVVVGPFFLCGLGEEDFVSLSDELLTKYRKEFRYPELFIPSL